MHKSPLTKYYYPHFTDKISEGSERLSNIPKAAQLLSGPAKILNLPPGCPSPMLLSTNTQLCELPHNPSSKAPPQWALGGPHCLKASLTHLLCPPTSLSRFCTVFLLPTLKEADEV